MPPYQTGDAIPYIDLTSRPDDSRRSRQASALGCPAAHIPPVTPAHQLSRADSGSAVHVNATCKCRAQDPLQWSERVFLWAASLHTAEVLCVAVHGTKKRCKCTHACTHARSRACTHMHACMPRTCTRQTTRAHARAHIHTRACTHVHKHAHTRTQIQTHARERACMHAHTHRYTTSSSWRSSNSGAPVRLQQLRRPTAHTCNCTAEQQTWVGMAAMRTSISRCTGRC
jgi:hypothetical protein